ncbi:hypothetical protein SprV_0602183700 [Sparganum proliferum]
MEIYNFTTEALNSSALRLSWDLPLGDEVHTYRINIQFNRTCGLRFTDDHFVYSNESTYVIADLPANREIDVSVEIVTGSGVPSDESVAENWSEVRRVKTYAVPSEPLAVRAEAINSSAVRISWRPPKNIDRKLNHYEMSLQYVNDDDSDVYKDMEIDPSLNSFVVNDLPNATEIQVTLRTIVGVGIEDAMIEYGKWGPTVIVHTPPVGMPIPIANITDISSNSVTIFTEILGKSGLDFVRVVNVDEPSIPVVEDVSSYGGQFLLINMQADTNYSIAVARSFLFHNIDMKELDQYFSDQIFIRTWPGVPSEPTNVTGSRLNATSVRVAWSKPMDPRGTIDGYRVEYSYVTPNGYVRDSLSQMNPDLRQADIHGLPSGVSVNVTEATKDSIHMPVIESKSSGKIKHSPDNRDIEAPSVDRLAINALGIIQPEE